MSAAAAMPSKTAPLAILGAGSLGTALSIGLWRNGRNFRLWTVEEDVAESLVTYRENVKYLPGLKVPREVQVTTSLEEALDGAGIILFAVPSSVVREVARRVGPLTPPSAVVVSGSKGLEKDSLLRMSQVISEEMPEPSRGRVAAMAGPSLAAEVGQELAAGVDIASDDLEVARTVKAALVMKRFRFKLRRDLAGVEAGGTFKNLYAIGAGICDGIGAGDNVKAALLSRAISEMVACARALGGKASTLYGLSGLGDLLVTSYSAHSRNRSLGEHLGRGHKVADAAHGMVSVTEGVDAALCAQALATRNNLRLPLAAVIHGILQGDEKPEAIVKVALP